MDRTRLITYAAKKWAEDLLDRSGRNPLLYYRDLRRGTLDLSEDNGVRIAAQLKMLNSSRVRLSHLFEDPDQLKEAARRARTIAAKARENDEERGVQTLFIAWGLTTWTDSRTTGPGSSSIPSAPVLLSPMSLKPSGGAAEDFQLRASEEWELNPTLLHHLETQFQFAFEDEQYGEYNVQENRVMLVEKLIRQAEQKHIPNFSINCDRLVVGNFSYKKLAMVKDIEEANKNGFLAENDLLSAIAGDREAQESLRDQHINFEPRNPDNIKPSDEFLILDADASQSNVINTVISGRDLVIEGPPGTGKSQTIANLIAALVAKRKSVLFVAEKRAAIDAVLKRLNDNYLSDIVLDLHETGAKSIKRRVANDIRSTLDKYTNSEIPQVASLQNDVNQYRAELNNQSHSFYQERSPWNKSVYDIQKNIIDLREKLEPSNLRLNNRVLESLVGDKWLRVLDDLKRFVDLDGLSLISESNSPSNPWTSAYREKALTTKEQLRDSLESLRFLDDHLNHSFEQWNSFASELNILKEINTIQQCKEIIHLIKHVEYLCQYIKPAACNMDRRVLHNIVKGSGWYKFLFRLLSSNYRQSMKDLNGYWQHDDRPTKRLLKKFSREILDIHQEWEKITGGKELLIPPSFPLKLSGHKIETVIDSIEDRVKRVGDPVLHDLTLDQYEQRVSVLLKSQQTLLSLVDIYEITERIHSNGIDQIIQEAARRQLKSEKTVELARYIWYMSLFDQICLDDQSIRNFRGPVFNQTVNQYKQLDREHIKSGRDRVLRQVAEWSVEVRNEYADECLVVQKQANRKRKHLTVRQLLDKAPNVLSTLKPCWAMSPLLVAETLPQKQLFDVVIFDEASQVTAADAIGPIMRAKNVVVTGDTKQLPPTRFFLGSFEEEEEDEEVDESLNLTSGFESILDVIATLLPPPHGTRNLSWHYRSHNERLIAFSNAQPSLYDGSLTTFPGTINEDCIRHILTEYDPGGTGKQFKEATKVVELILEHATQRPEESLGIITMGIKHAGIIEELLRQKRNHYPELDDWFDHGPEHRSDLEALFIKNIERVQGDERDNIILSIGYGRNPHGRMIHRFGPMNMEGGERRLNVAVTRARKRMTVVSSFTSNDLDPNKLRSEGAQMLGRYLAYAESGGADLGRTQTNTVPLNPFERDIQKGLQEAGIPLTAQYGSAGYWIDFAAGHPKQPGRMVLAIEADGASYHSSKTARDRDRLRQEHLERIGWRFHRIWSTEWFRNREQEIQRSLKAWESAVVDADKTSQPILPSAVISEPGLKHQTNIPQRKGTRPVQQGLPIKEYSQESLVRLINWIESDGRLLTDRDLLDIAVRELGFKRKGSRIVEALNKAIVDAHRGNRKDKG